MILVHICCSVDSHYFLQKLRKDFVDEEIIGFFYNPNIHPFSEYMLRLTDVKRSCDMLNIKLIDGHYDIDGWFDITKGHEEDPEKGIRCGICFNFRFENSAKMAKELNIDKMTSTLLTSPKKSLQQLQEAGDKIANKYGIEFITLDYRKNNGTQEQIKIAKENLLYQQNYCGCVYALNVQRENQGKVAYELLNPISKQVMPSSIESKIQLYQERMEIEKSASNSYKIIKNNFLNYRLLKGMLKVDGEAIPSYILYFSILKQKKAKYHIDYHVDNIYYLNRNNIRLLDINEFNKRLNLNYKNTYELMFDAPKVKDELRLREQIDSFYSTNPIVVVDKILDSKYELSLEAKIFDDIKENLVII